MNEENQLESIQAPNQNPEKSVETVTGVPEVQTNANVEAEIDYEAMALNPEAFAQGDGQVPEWNSETKKQEATAATLASQQAAIAELTQENEFLKMQLADMTNQYKRLAADFENFRRRNQKEKEELEQQIKGNTIKDLLPVIDNFELAKAHIKPQTEAEKNIHKSYQSVYKQLVDGLKRLGVSAMYPEGSPFDPNLHEAVMRLPTKDHPEGTVVEELRRGYVLGDRVLRHAMVKVAAPDESVVTSEENQEADSES